MFYTILTNVKYLLKMKSWKMWFQRKWSWKMKNEHQHCSLWSVGQIILINKGIDKKVWSVQVQLPNSTLTRPVNTLCLLEECE